MAKQLDGSGPQNCGFRVFFQELKALFSYKLAPNLGSTRFLAFHHPEASTGIVIQQTVRPSKLMTECTRSFVVHGQISKCPFCCKYFASCYKLINAIRLCRHSVNLNALFCFTVLCRRVSGRRRSRSTGDDLFFVYIVDIHVLF